MAKNDLQPGEPRLGWFVDGSPDTESIAVMLRDTGTAIELTVPLRGRFDKEDPYRRWWSSIVHIEDDPDSARDSYAPPRQLLVYDVSGPVALVGCRPIGSTTNSSVGHGRIVVNFAVLGGRNLDYDKINGLRTDIPALASWTRLSGMEVGVTTDERRRVQSVRMELTSAEPIRLARRLNLVMQSTWRTEQPTGGFQAFEAVNLETSVGRARTWDEHLQVHGAVLELVSIAAWQPFGIATTTVRRDDDASRNSAGGEMSQRWLPVATHRLPTHDPWTQEPRFLFPWSEVGSRGIERWLRLWNTHGRVIGPLLSVLRSENPWSHSSLVQSGIALEALGYLIDTENGSGHLNGRQQMNFRTGLRVILDDMSMKPFADDASWIDRSVAAYMGAKHPDRTEPDSLDMINTLRENLLVLRFWIGLQVGVTPASLSDALQTDVLADELIPLE